VEKSSSLRGCAADSLLQFARCQGELCQSGQNVFDEKIAVAGTTEISRRKLRYDVIDYVDV